MSGLWKGRGDILHGHCLYTWDRIKMDGAQKEINLDVVKESETCQYSKTATFDLIPSGTRNFV